MLDLVLSSCARQRIKFEEAWRIATPVALHGIEDTTLADELRSTLAAEPFRARVANLYERRAGRCASRSLAVNGQR